MDNQGYAYKIGYNANEESRIRAKKVSTWLQAGLYDVRGVD